MMEKEFRPQFQKIDHELQHRVKSKRFKEIVTRCDDIDDKARRNGDRITGLEAGMDSLTLKVEEQGELMKASPAKRRAAELN